MVLRKPLVTISGVTSELPPSDTIEGTSVGSLTAGSGLAGGGSLASNQRVDVSLAAAPSGLIFVGNQLGLDGAAQASGNAALTSAATAQASGNAALTSAAAKLPLTGGVLTGDLTLNAQSDLRFADSDSSNWVAFQAPATVASNVTWTLPSADGSASQVLSTNGSGSLSWATAGGSSKIVQVVNTSSTAFSSGTGTIPYDNTIPQNTEGTEFMTLSITPTNASNYLFIQIIALITVDTNRNMTGALFQDTTANAIAAIATYIGTGGYYNQIISLNHYMTAGTTSATTFKFRAGGDGASTTFFNGDAFNRLYGAITKSSITIMEVAA